MSVLPDKVSHGGTYAGNRVAAAAAVKTLSILARHGRARDDPRDRPARPGRPARGPQRRPACRTTSPATRRCSGSCSREAGADRVPRLGDHRPRAVRRDRDRHARPRRDARAGLARAVVHVRGARRGRHRRPDRLDLLATRSTRPSRPARTASSAPTPHWRDVASGRRLNGTGRRWSSTATRSARSTGRRRSCSPSARARARPG